MDIGTFTNNGTDNMYVGLKNEASAQNPAFPAGDKHDAVINWGDNGGSNPLNGPDHLRFIFTETMTSGIPGNAPATSNNGLEVARFTPELASTLTAPNYGMMGVGDFSPGSTAFGTLDAKLDIDGDLRIRQVTQIDSLVRVLVIDSTDSNRVHWRDVSTLGGLACWDLNSNGIQDFPAEDTDGNGVIDALDCQGAVGPTGATGPVGPPGTGGGNVTADNGLSISPANNVQLGQNYPGFPSLPSTGVARLLGDREIPLDDNRLYFSGLGNVGIGALGNAKLNIRNDANLNSVLLMNTSNGDEIFKFTETKKLTINAERTAGEQAILMHNKIVNSPGTIAALTGLDVFTETDDNVNPYLGARIRMLGKSNQTVTGLWVSSRSKLNDGTSDYIGIQGNADRSTDVLIGKKIGVKGFCVSPALQNIGVDGAAFGATTNIGVRGSSNGPNSFAGWFQGHVNITGVLTLPSGIVTGSDNMFKTNQQNLTNATSIINQLVPKTYNLDSANFTQFGFDTKQHMGLIAQEVEQVLPNLVSNNTMIAQYDTAGVQTHPQTNYKGLNYQEFIPLLIAGMQEQQGDLNAKDSVIDNLEDRLAALEECLSNTGICNDNGHGNNGHGNRVVSPDVELNNLNAIILDQNLPNPFKEKTTINYSIPEEVMEATLLFYDLNGRIIKQVDITERGEGKLTVYGENLKNGIYTYSLIADGKLIATKKMVKSK